MRAGVGAVAPARVLAWVAAFQEAGVLAEAPARVRVDRAAREAAAVVRAAVPQLTPATYGVHLGRVAARASVDPGVRVALAGVVEAEELVQA
jgi:hypothetical protein